MANGIVRIYYGEGHGKWTAALGTAMREAAYGKTSIIVSFLKGKKENSASFLSRLDPELKFFSFEKNNLPYDELSKEEQQDEVMNLRNAYNYGKKVVSTGASDLVVLDGILGMIEKEIISEDELLELLNMVPEDMVVICTGKNVPDKVKQCADELYQVTLEK